MSLQSNRIYINNLIELLQKIDYEIVDQIIKILEEAAHKQSSIYIIGNGGSAATASHMVNDLGAGLRRRGLINLDITSLADNVPVITAIANDIGYENIFYMQLEGLLKPEDLIIAISCSGNSPNVVKAVEYAKNIGSTIIGITGFDGGDLKKLSDVNFHIEAPKGEYGLVEDMHMILDHMIYSYYINKGKINVG
ncbi:MAG: SIS domain-containing protein [Sulfuricurvum sp.]|nr:SIS domain-containing protein [Sulfuricurvum sp.]